MESRVHGKCKVMPRHCAFTYWIAVYNDYNTDDIDWVTDIHAHVRAVTPDDYTMSAYVYVSSASEGVSFVSSQIPSTRSNI